MNKILNVTHSLSTRVTFKFSMQVAIRVKEQTKQPAVETFDRRLVFGYGSHPADYRNHYWLVTVFTFQPCAVLIISSRVVTE